MIIDHVGLAVSDLKKSHDFYAKALAPLGIEFIKEVAGWHGFGQYARPEFWLGVRAEPQKCMHIAFSAQSREQVRQFYQAALDAGATHKAAPSIMAEYHADFYGAMVFDPDGNNIEAVCHTPE